MTALTNRDDRVRLGGFWLVLGLALAIAFIVLQLTRVASPTRDDLRVAPAAANHAAGGLLRAGRP